MMKYRKICNLDFDIPSESFVYFTYLGNQITQRRQMKSNTLLKQKKEFKTRKAFLNR